MLATTAKAPPVPTKKSSGVTAKKVPPAKVIDSRAGKIKKKKAGICGVKKNAVAVAQAAAKKRANHSRQRPKTQWTDPKPAAMPSQQSEEVGKKDEPYQSYSCPCGTPNDGAGYGGVQCDTCKSWFHLPCAGSAVSLTYSTC